MDDFKTIARTITIIENHLPGYEEILLRLPAAPVAPVLGITGAPGSGKSTLVDALIACITATGQTAAVLCIDPSSPFNTGALLGDRIRMSRWYLDERVFIRSLASRKELGGLCPMSIEITEYVKTAGFDYVIIETVGVGQSEIEIAGLADVTIVNLVPGSGDEIQTMKAGIMEIADIFVVNKSDKPGADLLIRDIRAGALLTKNKASGTPVIKTVANVGTGIDELYNVINKMVVDIGSAGEKRCRLLAEKAYQLIQEKRMSDVRKDELYNRIKMQTAAGQAFNLYRFVQPMLQ